MTKVNHWQIWVKSIQKFYYSCNFPVSLKLFFIKNNSMSWIEIPNQRFTDFREEKGTKMKYIQEHRHDHLICLSQYLLTSH